jgi:hypothetical protein
MEYFENKKGANVSFLQKKIAFISEGYGYKLCLGILFFNRTKNTGNDIATCAYRV